MGFQANGRRAATWLQNKVERVFFFVMHIGCAGVYSGILNKGGLLVYLGGFSVHLGFFLVSAGGAFGKKRIFFATPWRVFWSAQQSPKLAKVKWG